jgi:hypothetical protein
MVNRKQLFQSNVQNYENRHKTSSTKVLDHVTNSAFAFDSAMLNSVFGESSVGLAHECYFNMALFVTR